MTSLVPEELFRLFVDEAVDYAIILFDGEAIVQHWNTGAQRLFGYTPDEAAGRRGSFIFVPEDVAAGIPERELETAARTGHAADRRWKQRKDGSRFFGEGLMTALRRNDGVLLGYAKIIRDATAEKLREEERAAEDRRAEQRSSIQTGVTVILRDAATFEEAVPQILGHMARTLGWDFAAFWEVDARANVLRCWNTWSAFDRPSPFSDRATFAVGEGLPGRAHSTGRAVWIEEIARERDTDFPRRASALAAGFVSALAFPIVLAGETLGVMELFACRRTPEAVDLIAPLELAGAQIGHFIERRRAELAVRDSEARYRAVAETATDAILTIDTQSTILYANPAVERLLGYSREELIGTAMSTLIPERLREAHQRGMARYLQTGVKRVRWDGIELPVLRRDGTEMPTEIRFGEFVEGERRLFTGYIRDIGERKRADQEKSELLRATEEARERATFVSEVSHVLAETIDYEETMRRIASVAVPRLADWCAVDLLRDGDRTLKRLAVEHVDPARVRLARELQERYPADLFRTTGVAQAIRERTTVFYQEIPDDMLRAEAQDDAHLRLVRELGLRAAIITPLIAADRVLGAMTFVTSGSRRLTPDDVTIAEDVAVRASVAIQNAELYREAQDANRAKDDFLATVSHELRTPMTAVLGWAKLLRDETDPELVAEAAMAIERSATAQAKLIEDILDIARIRVGKLRMRFESANLVEVVEAAADTVRLTAEAKHISLAVELDRTLPLVQGDAQRLQQLVWNLLSNAVKFTPEDGRVAVSLTGDGVRAVLTVTDSGPGIPKDFLPHLFERFRQAEAMHRRSHGGLGLGLSLARYIADAHGGTIRVHTAEGKGSTFIVELPLTPAETAKAEKGGRRAFDPVPSLRGLSVLVVEDDKEARQFLSRVLERAGADVEAVASVREALHRIATRPADVVLSDIAMPEQTGYDLLRTIRSSRQGSDLRVVAVTASGTAGDRERALSAGFDEYVRKPVDPHVLVEIVRAVAEAE